MGIFNEPYVKEAKPVPVANNEAWKRIIDWDIYNPSAGKVIRRADGSLAYVPVARYNPYMVLDDMTKDLIEREFINILRHEGFTCEHVENRVFKISRRMWSMTLDVEPMLPFGDQHIKAVINNYKYNVDDQGQARRFEESPYLHDAQLLMSLMQEK